MMRITSTQSAVEEPGRGILSRSIVLNWEVVLFVTIFLLAVFTRFYMLGDRVMSHDESLHTRYSWNLYENGNFQHTPLMHGPILFHFTALSYALFGDSDFSARIYTSVLSVLLVMSPILFRRWLGRWGTILASLMLLISPIILYYGRYIRHDTPSILSALLMIWAMLMYLGGPPNQQRRAHWLYVIAAAMIWNLGSKETAFIYIAIIGIFLAIYFAVRLLQYFLRTPGKPIFYLGMIGIFLGGVMSLGMYIILDIVQFDMLSATETTAFSALSVGEQQTFWLWTFLAIGSVVLVTIGTMLWAFRDRLTRLPLLELAAVLAIALTVSFSLVVVEEISHTDPTSTSEPASPADPNAEGVTAEDISGMSWTPMYLVWGGALAGFALLFFTRVNDARNHGSKDKPGRGFWGTLDLFPEFDLIVVIGTLILPWATALVPYLMRGTPADFAQVANNLPQPIFTFIATYVPRVGTAEQIGQFLLSFYAWVPLMLFSISLGLMWNWKRWLVASAIFHVLFAFFFTTIFTNIAGLATGMIYSLGYWLEQQGVRRGSQPQYYYLLVIMPFYEFLPVIGGVLSMFAGMTVFWRWRRDSREEAFEQRDARLAALTNETDVDLQDEPSTKEVLVIETAELPAATIASTEEEEIFLRSSLEEEDDLRFGEPIELEPKERRKLVARRYRQKMWSNPLFYVFAGLLVLTLLITVLSGFTIIAAPGGILGMVIAYFAWRYNRESNEEIDRELALGLSLDAIEEGGLPKRKRDERMADTKTFREEVTANAYASNLNNALTSVPFLIFFSWLAVLNLVGYSLAGEKMPWLGTHLSLPLIFLTAWYFGRIISKINWRKFTDRGWIILAVLIVFAVALSRVIQPLLMGTPPFAGLSQDQLQATYSWLGALVVVVGSLVAVFYLRETVGWKHVRQLFAVVIFGLLSVITFRSAWLASFVNYDYATEYLVYAHAAPGVKWVLEDIEELSLRTTDGYDIAVAYDNEVSWPYSWYFRDYENVTYTGENPTVQNLQDAVVVVVGAAHLGTVEPILEDRYVRFDHIRLWWPMQDYFHLTPDRINNLLDFSADNPSAAQIRQGIFDIWWARDYSTYGAATSKNFDVTAWPVSDKMHFYVRRDIAAQIWPYGVGDGTVLNPLDEIEVNQCNANWQDMTAVQVLQAPDGMTNPIGISIAPDGTVYVAEEFGHRISAFDLITGAYIESIGQEGTQALGETLELNRPNSISIAPDGTLYIADTWNYRVQILNPDFTPIDFFGQPGTYGFDAPVSPTEGLWGPRDVAVSNDGLIFVSDTGNKRVRVYRVEDGVALHQYDIGSGGSAPGQLDEPSGLAVSDDGRLFVADTWNRRISVFTLDGNYLDSYSVRGWYEELGNRPYLAIDENRDLLYVTDPDAGRVLVYTLSGDCVGSFGQAAASSPTLGQFGIAAGIAVDDEGFIYVVDNQFGRVLKFLPFPYVPPSAVNGVEESEVDAAESQEVEAVVTEEVDAQE